MTLPGAYVGAPGGFLDGKAKLFDRHGTNVFLVLCHRIPGFIEKAVKALRSGRSQKASVVAVTTGLLERIAKHSPHGPQHAATMRRWVDETAARGYGESHGEREEGLSAVAAPVLGRSGGVVAALALSGPSIRFTPDRVAEFAADLREMARQMSERGFDRPFGGPG